MNKNYLILKMAFGLFFLNSTFVYAQTAEQYLHLGNISGRQQKYQDAVLDYTKAIHSNPKYDKAYYNRGYVYLEIRKYKLAIADLDKAIEINPKYAAAYHVRGIAYFSRKKYVQAVADYSKAIELDPKNVHFYISRMSANCKLGDSDKAWSDVTKIQQLGGTVNPAIINLLKNKQYRN